MLMPMMLVIEAIETVVKVLLITQSKHHDFLPMGFTVPC